MCSNLLALFWSTYDKANSILDILFSSINVGFRKDVWTRQTSWCNNIRCTVLNATPIAFAVEQYVLRGCRGISFRPCRNSACEYLRQFMLELFGEAISREIIRDCSHALHACRHNLLMVLHANPISAATMVSEPHGNTPSCNRPYNKPNALFCRCNDISL